jgi:hypothetical protein
MMSFMWVYMATWIVKDGAPELGRGSFLRGAGLRASCLSVDPAGARADGITELVDDGGGRRRGGHAYELTGLAGAARDVFAGDGPAERHAGSEFVITAGDQRYIARAAGPASEVPAGSRITAQCTLSVVADYEWDAFGLPDLRSDWHVLRLKIEHSQIDDAHGSPGQVVAGPSGTVLRSFEIDHMSRWDDDRDPKISAWYVLDLLPIQAL